MTIVIIAVALVVAFVIAYNLNKKPVEKVETVQAPEKIEPPVVEEVKVEPVASQEQIQERKNRVVKKVAEKKAPINKSVQKKELVKKAVKKTK